MMSEFDTEAFVLLLKQSQLHITFFHFFQLVFKWQRLAWPLDLGAKTLINFISFRVYQNRKHNLENSF